MMPLGDKKDAAKSAFASVTLSEEAKLLKEGSLWKENLAIERAVDIKRTKLERDHARTREVRTAKEFVARVETMEPGKFSALSTSDRAKLLRADAERHVGNVEEYALQKIDIEKHKAKKKLYERAKEAAEQKARAKLKSDFSKSADKARSRER